MPDHEGTGELSLTDEQIEVVRSDAARLRVYAFAGAGKTTTLEAYARARPDRSFLYVAFNRSVREEAQNRFPDNVEARTAHSIAYRKHGRNYRDQLSGGLRLRTVRDAIADSVDYHWAGVVRQGLRNFLASGDQDVRTDHIPPSDEVETQPAIEHVENLFERMLDPGDRDVPMIHDGYLKRFQLDGPDLTDRWDVILYDEAQDLNPVTHAIFLEQDMPIVMVGDPHQQIYRFRGSVNAMQKFEAEQTLYLSKSFRFGDGIADLCTGLLKKFKELPRAIRGTGENSNIQTIDPEKPFAILHRTFAGTFETAAMETRLGNKLNWVGGIRNYELGRVKDVYHLYENRPDRIDDYRLKKSFGSYEEYRMAARESNDQELKKMCGVVEKFNDSIPRVLRRIKDHSTEDPDRADRILSTAHRAKGKEWDQVKLSDDFPRPGSERWDREMTHAERVDEVNLFYVAMTRARRNLNVPEFLLKALDDRNSPEDGSRKGDS